MRKAVGVVAVGATAALIGAGTGVGASASVAAPHTSAVSPTMPTIKVTASGKHSYKVSGSTTFTAGRVQLVLKSVKGEHEAELGSLHKGYTFKKLRADLRAFDKGSQSGQPTKSAIKHLDHAVKNTNFYGGLDSTAGQTEHGTMVLPKAGKYLVVNDTGALPKLAGKLTVTAPTVSRAAPKSAATVTALTKRRFGGAKTLPAKGTITFKNKSTESPHFLGLLHVKKGTTKKQVLQEFESNGSGPNYFLKGQAATDPVGEGNSQTLTYKVPKGTYAEICFFPDPKTGMPHAFMGMIRIVKLK